MEIIFYMCEEKRMHMYVVKKVIRAKDVQLVLQLSSDKDDEGEVYFEDEDYYDDGERENTS